MNDKPPDAEQEADPCPHLATNGDDPLMALEEREPRSKNGSDKNFIPQLRELVGKVRFGWSVAVSMISPIVGIAGFLIYTEWLSIPAKSVDMKAAQATISSQGETLKTLGVDVIRVEEHLKAQDEKIDRIDRNIDRLLDLQLRRDEQKRASAAPAAPAYRPRQALPKKEEGGGFLFSR